MVDVITATRASVAAFVAHHALLPAGTVVVAVSGGTDLVCLLDCLFFLKHALKITLHVAHLDHGLRDDGSSAADAAYVRDLAARCGLPVTCERRDVQALVRNQHLSVEAAARIARYEFLESVAWRLEADHLPGESVRIATGHTASDQAETVLLHLIRGSGLAGLAGMRPRRGRIVRPLLDIDRDTTIAYCMARDLAPRQDPTNDSRVFLRNRIRHDLLPTLAQYNPQVDDALARTASLLAEDVEYLDMEAARFLPGLLLSDNTEEWATERYMDISSEAWLATPNGLRAHLVRGMLTRLYGSTEGFTHHHIVRLRQIMGGQQDGPAAVSPDHEEGAVSAARQSARVFAQFPHQLWVEQRAGMTRLRAGHPAPPASFPSQRLNIPGDVALPGGLLTATRLDVGDIALLTGLREHLQSSTVYLDAAATGDELSVRSRHPGDVIQPLGMGGHHRKVQDVLVDAHIPRDIRDAVPIIARHGIAPTREEIVWIVGLCVADPFRVTAKTTQVLCLRWESTTDALSPRSSPGA